MHGECGCSIWTCSGPTAENAATAGQKLYVQYGITGVRGQVEAALAALDDRFIADSEKGLLHWLLSLCNSPHCENLFSKSTQKLVSPKLTSSA